MQPLKILQRRVVEWATVAYAACIVAVTVLLARVGESWWVTAVGLYLPRLPFAVPAPVLAVLLWRSGSRRHLGLLAVTCVIVLVPLMGFSAPAPSWLFGHKDGPHLRLLSYNVDSSVGGVANLAAEVDANAPDVVFMQETGYPTTELVAAMKARFPTVVASGQFITASRFPLVSEVLPEKLDFEGRHRSARFIETTLQTPLGDVAFYNVHPISPREELYRLRGHGLRREILSGRIFSGGDAAQPIVDNASLRDLQVETFAEEASHESVPTIVAGDTNLPGLSATLRRRLGGFQDGFRQAGWGFGYTFPTNKWLPWMRIDRVFASAALRFTSFRVGRSLASDHHCVVADLQLR